MLENNNKHWKWLQKGYLVSCRQRTKITKLPGSSWIYPGINRRIIWRIIEVQHGSRPNAMRKRCIILEDLCEIGWYGWASQATYCPHVRTCIGVIKELWHFLTVPIRVQSSSSKPSLGNGWSLNLLFSADTSDSIIVETCIRFFNFIKVMHLLRFSFIMCTFCDYQSFIVVYMSLAYQYYKQASVIRRK